MTDLDATFADLREGLAWAEPGDVTSAVVSRLAAQAAIHARPRRRRVAVVVGVVVVALGIGPARGAVAGLLGIEGVEVKVLDDLPADLPAAPDLGRPVGLRAARATVAFPLRLPDTLGPPDAAYVGSPPDGVSFVWDGEDLLLTQHPGTAGVIKQVADQVTAQMVPVDGGLGLWLTGPHVVAYTTPDGTPVTEPPRRAGRTLVWSRDGVVFRIETEATLAEALALAASLSP